MGLKSGGRLASAGSDSHEPVVTPARPRAASEYLLDVAETADQSVLGVGLVDAVGQVEGNAGDEIPVDPALYTTPVEQTGLASWGWASIVHQNPQVSRTGENMTIPDAAGPEGLSKKRWRRVSEVGLHLPLEGLAAGNGRATHSP